MRAARLAMLLDDPEQKEALLRNVLAILVREPNPPAKKIEAVLVNYEKARADCGIGPQGESRGRLRAALAAAKPELLSLLRPPDERNLAATELDLNPYGGIERPVVIRRADPLYPEEARRRRIEGTVILEALISRNGDPTEIKLLRSLDPVLDRESVKAVTAWKYQPAKIGECAIPTYTTVTVTFRLSH